MKRKFNKFVRYLHSRMQGNDLTQELTGGVTGEITVTPGMPELIRETAAEGCILLKNDGVLPLIHGKRVSIFGRVQRDYFTVGYGSGGDVRTSYEVNLIDGLRNSRVNINEKLAELYDNWSSNPKNEVDPGFWGHWPRYFPEMHLKEELVREAAQEDDTALVVIGRAAGESRENILKPGSYYLTKEEKRMLNLVTNHFKKTVVIMNCGNIIDMEWNEAYGSKLSAVLWPWLGGMESGNAIADVLTGKVNPCGRLTTTIAREYKDYPSAAHFGKKEGNNYVEDIFAGYRYFETFAPEKVLYPFGFGLSYTRFKTACETFEMKHEYFKISVTVHNTGELPGKEVVQLYVSAPQGLLGKATKVLIDFGKTGVLKPGETQTMKFRVPLKRIASYDDSGITGKKSAYILEAGEYKILTGSSVHHTNTIANFKMKDLKVIEQLSEVMAVKHKKRFKRITARIIKGGLHPVLEEVPTVTTNLKKIILERLPEAIEQTGDKGFKLQEVPKGKLSLNEFIAQLSLEELEALSLGQGTMRSTLGTAGNAGALGGVTESLRAKGIPPVITADGPSGIRIKKSCSLIPCGTLIASTWDTDLVQRLFSKLGEEILERQVDIILSPGMNIHRNPLCGRNFEYYSEDPFVTGKIAAATVRGIQHNGISACPKHFAANNQEINRNRNDSRISERALREIYLTPFEILVKESEPLNIMTSYNKINGVWSHYNYELVTTVLRDEWGYKGNVITDWWMRYAPSPEFPALSGNAYRVRAQVDVLMPGFENPIKKKGEKTSSLLVNYGNKDGISLGEMQRTAKNVLTYILKSSAMDERIPSGIV